MKSVHVLGRGAAMIRKTIWPGTKSWSWASTGCRGTRSESESWDEDYIWSDVWADAGWSYWVPQSPMTHVSYCWRLDI